MTESKAWYKPLLDAVVKEMLHRKAVVGAAVEATPVWAFPEKILIAKVWGTGEKAGLSGPFQAMTWLWTKSPEKWLQHPKRLPGTFR